MIRTINNFLYEVGAEIVTQHATLFIILLVFTIYKNIYTQENNIINNNNNRILLLNTKETKLIIDKNIYKLEK